MHTDFGIINFLVLILYFLLSIGIGGYFFKEQKSTRDYFLGSKNVPWYAVAVSVSATVISSITYIGAPAYVYSKNLSLWLTTVPVLLATPIVMFLILPFFFNLNVYTAYEYLEKRFDIKTRTFASILFLFLRSFNTAVIIYATAIALAVVMNFDLTLTILAMGIISAFYTMLGGMKAVIWTDFLQFIVLFGGLVVTAALLLYRVEGGASTIYTVANEAGRLRLFDFSLDFTKPVTIWGAIIGCFFYNLAMYGTDQVVLQRYLTTKSIRESRRALLLNASYILPIGFLNYLIGAGIFAFYFLYPDSKTAALPKDGIFPYFIVTQMPAGTGGLVVAGIFAAAMSTISSAINSLSTASIVDFYQRFNKTQHTPEHYLKIARWFTFGWGIIITGLAFTIQFLGQVAEAVMKTNGFFGGVLLGVFLLGMLIRRATGYGAFRGAIIAMIVISIIGFGTSISFTWYSMIGALSAFLLGIFFSLRTTLPPKETLQGLVVKWLLK